MVTGFALQWLCFSPNFMVFYVFLPFYALFLSPFPPVSSMPITPIKSNHKQLTMHSSIWPSLMWHKKQYLSKPLCVSVGCCGNYNFLSPLWSKEMLKISLKGLQSGQLLREVDGLYSRVGWIPVQSLLQCLVDLIQGAQKNLEAKGKKGDLWEMNIAV